MTAADLLAPADPALPDDADAPVVTLPPAELSVEPDRTRIVTAPMTTAIATTTPAASAARRPAEGRR